MSLADSGDASPRDIAAVLRECIDDLRLSIDSLEYNDCELLPALGNFRYRIDGRLRAVGIELDWRVEAFPALPYLSPQTLLHILRILQEAFANVLKHAHANHVRMEAGVAPGERRVFIRVCDNGHGFDGSERNGRGLGNMKRRATSIGGDLHIASGREGTTVELLLPLA